MFIDDQTYTKNNKIYRRILLRNSYRVNGKIRHDTIANLSQCSDEEIKAFKLAIKHKGDLNKLTTEKSKTKQGLSVGAVWTINHLAKELGISKALGKSREAKLCLWMIMATVIEQGSRLSATRLAQRHAVCDILNIDSFNEDDLYKAMDWLEERQDKIENQLFNDRYGNHKPQFYLYDVTSSYFEGQQNELSAWGYNRDGKKGKKQIVIGLMTDEDGCPICTEVFQGNIKDTGTVKNQIEKIANRFGVKEVTMVGDRGMIKSIQIKDLSEEDFHYITAITKPQIEKLIKKGIFQLALFDDDIAEITDNNTRYIFRRNPVRADVIAIDRESKLDTLKKLVAQQNRYLAEHSRAKVEVALRKCIAKSVSLRINKWAKCTNEGREIQIEIDTDEKDKASRLDGCYVLKTDLPASFASSYRIHERYKDLTEVEFAFRTMKTVFLEMRGIYVRKANRTRAHVFIIMLAYLIAYKLRRLWYDVEVTVEEGVKELASVCSTIVLPPGQESYQTIPEPRELGKILLSKIGVTLPDVFISRNIKVVTRKKLVSERKIKKYNILNKKIT
ncbi:MAG: IS1634 family transposase [Candidatus Delongbacteria bacterium]|nr:IS1634 family transposase [Candidatus Delongbacteria bacterium]